MFTKQNTIYKSIVNFNHYISQLMVLIIYLILCLTGSCNFSLRSISVYSIDKSFEIQLGDSYMDF